jgi:hypothetical protein
MEVVLSWAYLRLNPAFAGFNPVMKDYHEIGSAHCLSVFPSALYE